jgi:hypothetical protein
VPNVPCPVAASAVSEILWDPEWQPVLLPNVPGYWYYTWTFRLSITCGQGTNQAFCKDCMIVQVEQQQANGSWLPVASTGANWSVNDTICNLTTPTDYEQGWGQATDPTGAANPAPGSVYRFAAYIAPMPLGDWPSCDGFTTAGGPTLTRQFALNANP